jgi:hypothetical protein
MDEEGEDVARAIVESYDVPWLDDECSAAYSTRFDLIIMRQAYFSSSLEAESTLMHEAAHAARGHHEYFSLLLKSGLIYCVGNSGFVHANGKGTFWEEAFAGLLEGLYRKRYRPGVILRHIVAKLKDPVVTNEFGLQVQFRNTDDGALISLPLKYVFESQRLGGGLGVY